MSSEHVHRFESRVLMVRYYEDEYKCIADMQSADLMQRLVIIAMTRPERVQALAALYGTHPNESAESLIESGALAFAFVIAGQGPQAFGMPEMFAPSQNLKHHSVLERYSILMTDGRYSGVTKGPCVGHVTPEAWSGGGIGALQDGDLLCLQLTQRRIDWIDADALCAGKIDLLTTLPTNDRAALIQDRKTRMNERRKQIASCNLMDDVSEATFGAVPGSVHRAATIAWSV